MSCGSQRFELSVQSEWRYVWGPMSSSTINPYESPAHASRTEGIDATTKHFGDASTGERFLHFIVDYVAIQIVTTIVMFLLFVLAPSLMQTTWIPYAIGLPIMFAYYTLFEFAFGRTVGKLVVGTRVVTERDTSPTFSQVLLRSLVRYVPFEVFSVLGGNAWHDGWSKTRVVKVRRPRALRGLVD